MKLEKGIKKEWKNILFNFVFAAITIAIIVIFHTSIIKTTMLVGIVSILGLVKWKSKITLIMFVIGALFGTFAEMISIYYGAWNYAVSNFVNVPIWLFLVWGNATVFIYQTALELKKLGIKK